MRTWHDGDTVALKLPMALRTETTGQAAGTELLPQRQILGERYGVYRKIQRGTEVAAQPG